MGKDRYLNFKLEEIPYFCKDLMNKIEKSTRKKDRNLEKSLKSKKMKDNVEGMLIFYKREDPIGFILYDLEKMYTLLNIKT